MPCTISHLSYEDLFNNFIIILSSAAFFQLLSSYVHRFTRQTDLFPHVDDLTLKMHLNVDFSSRIPSTLHSFFSFSFSVFYFYQIKMHPSSPIILPLVQDPLTGHAPIMTMLTSVSAGYFLWDLCYCLSHFRVFGTAFTFHAAVCFFTYLMPLVNLPFMYWIESF